MAKYKTKNGVEKEICLTNAILYKAQGEFPEMAKRICKMIGGGETVEEEILNTTTEALFLAYKGTADKEITMDSFLDEILNDDIKYNIQVFGQLLGTSKNVNSAKRL